LNTEIIGSCEPPSPAATGWISKLPFMANEIQKPGDSGLKKFLKAIVLIVVILLGIVVVVFGLLVGVCFLGARR
jgi:Na+/H+-dicarboxylate symporter